MSLRATFILVSVSLAVLILAGLGVMALHLRTLGALEAAENRRHDSLKLADELRQSSDDLTRMARTYVVTGDVRYEEYFNRILEIRNGEAPRPENYDGIYWDFVGVGGVEPAKEGEPVALDELMRRADFTDLEFATLRKAEEESNALVALEERAMAAVKGLYPDANGEYTREGAPDAALARELMHGAEYHAAKSRIMAPIADFIEMLESRTQRDVTAMRLRSRRLMVAALAIGVLSLSLVGASVFILHRRVVRPVSSLVVAAHAVEQGDYSERVTVHVEDEIGRLAATFNLMTEAIESDVAARERREGELRKLSRAVEQSPAAVLVTDHNGNIEYVNPKFTRITGYEPDEVLGHNPRMLNSGQQSPEFYEELWSTIKSGREWSGEFCNRKKNGELFWESASISPIRDAGGEITHYVAVKEDVTDRKRDQEALQEAKEAAEEATRAKSMFLANMSHEIRTPMNGIIGMTELALDTDLTPEQRDYLNTVNSSAEALLALINDILDFSKIEAGRLELDPVPFELRDALADMLNTLAVRAHGKGLELLYDVPADVHDALIGDVHRLRQIVVNLVGNAIKFTSEGEIVVTVETVRQDDAEIELHFTVRDTGIGIPSDRLDAIFQPFEQADISTTKEYGGTGLGLAISVQLAECMGGRLRAESEVGRGSTFYFTAVFGRGTAKPRVDIDRQRVAIEGLPVLVVDDNETNRRILEQLTTNWGMQPRVASSGADALAALDRSVNAGAPFRLVLSDVNMPKMDGFDLFERLQTHAEHRDLPVIFLTSAARPGDVAKCRELGVAAHLIKPVKQSLLLDAIMSAVGERSAARSERLDATPAPAAGEAGDDRPLRILLAEDNPTNQKFALRAIEKAGHSAVVANNGREAVDALEDGSYDVVLMDVHMPEMDGLEATRAIRDRERAADPSRRTPIIAMTANAMKGDREECIQAGMDGYVSKPVKRATLFAEIDRVLNELS